MSYAGHARHMSYAGRICGHMSYAPRVLLNPSLAEPRSCRPLGKKLRRPQEPDNSIEEWLKHNNAIAQDQDRPAFMTVDLYLTQNMKEERALKQNAPNDAPTPRQQNERKHMLHK